MTPVFDGHNDLLLRLHQAPDRRDEIFLTGEGKGHRDLPRQMPDSYAMGSKEEALCFAEVLRSAWARHPQALAWLAEQQIK